MVEGDGSGGAVASWSGGASEAKPREGRGRISRADLVEFRRALDAATRRAIVTPMIVLACGAAFAAMTASGVPILWPYASQLVGWGANDGARLILRHEYWRLGASVFIHGGLIHLVVNMWSLFVIGPLVERIYGHLAFAVLYLAAGIAGAIASAAVPPVRVSVGASGAICGVLGGLLAFLLLHRRAIPPSVLRQLSKNVASVVIFMAVLGLVVPNIDQAAHIGGLAAGFVVGMILIGPWPVVPGLRRRLTARRLALIVPIAIAVAGSAVAVANRGDDFIPPARRMDDLTEQLAPIIREFSSIRMVLTESVGLFDGGADAFEREAGRATLRKLRTRALRNADRIRSVRTSQPDLRAVCVSLTRALDGQIDRLDALDRYLETGDPAALDAARVALAMTVQASRDCEQYQLRYLARYWVGPHGAAGPARSMTVGLRPPWGPNDGDGRRRARGRAGCGSAARVISSWLGLTGALRLTPAGHGPAPGAQRPGRQPGGAFRDGNTQGDRSGSRRAGDGRRRPSHSSG